MAALELITENIDLWTSAIRVKPTQGRGSNKKLELYGIKKLRELILELAVRGKLVPQDPNDEPASVLLEQIAADKARWAKEKISRYLENWLRLAMVKSHLSYRMGGAGLVLVKYSILNMAITYQRLNGVIQVSTPFTVQMELWAAMKNAQSVNHVLSLAGKDRLAL